MAYTSTVPPAVHTPFRPSFNLPVGIRAKAERIFKQRSARRVCGTTTLSWVLVVVHRPQFFALGGVVPL